MIQNKKSNIYIMYKTIFSLLIFLIVSILLLLFLAPFIDHFFYVDHKLEETEESNN